MPAVLHRGCQLLVVGYLIWRALRTLTPGWGYFYSLPLWISEYIMFLMSNIFIMSLWHQIERPQRFLSDMLEREELPHVDIFIVCYSGNSCVFCM